MAYISYQGGIRALKRSNVFNTNSGCGACVLVNAQLITLSALLLLQIKRFKCKFQGKRRWRPSCGSSRGRCLIRGQSEVKVKGECGAMLCLCNVSFINAYAHLFLLLLFSFSYMFSLPLTHTNISPPPSRYPSMSVIACVMACCRMPFEAFSTFMACRCVGKPGTQSTCPSPHQLLIWHLEIITHYPESSWFGCVYCRFSASFRPLTFWF